MAWILLTTVPPSAFKSTASTRVTMTYILRVNKGFGFARTTDNHFPLDMVYLFTLGYVVGLAISDLEKLTNQHIELAEGLDRLNTKVDTVLGKLEEKWAFFIFYVLLDVLLIIPNF